MLEVEMKFRVEDAADYEKRLKDEFGIEFGAPSTEEDLFFDNAQIGFNASGRALRIRRRGEYLATTFKGPRLDAETKTREEIELPLFPEKSTSEESVEKTRADWVAFYERLGFAPFAKVRKIRRRGVLTFEGREFEITLDEVPPLGFFTEIETIATKEELAEARSATILLSRKLRLGETVVKSYRGLLKKAGYYAGN